MSYLTRTALGRALGGCALAALVMAATQASAQDNAQATADTGQLEEVVVTATRQSSTVNRVPLSITAQTQRNMDQQGIRQIGDLVGTVPSLSLTQTTPGVSNIAIRGIASNASTNTAATTGFYLDDTPLQKRGTAGFLNGNGTPLPPLFDLDRVEVLRGPQGTLFGGSSQGGTVRYITPTPSLTRYTAYVRAEASTMKDGDESYELGVAVGGPIIQDKLGFRASVYAKELGGYIDYIDPFTKQERYKNANSGESRMFRGSVLWAITDRARATFAYFNSTDRSDSNVSNFTLPINNAITEVPVCYNTSAITPQRPNPNPAPVACGTPGVTFQRAGGTFGPYPDLKPYDLVSAAGLAPTKTIINLPTLTFDYDFDTMSVKSITSYIHDHNFSYSNSFGNDISRRTGLYQQAGVPPSAAFPAGGQFNNGLAFTYALPDFRDFNSRLYGYAQVDNRRYGLTQEVRFASQADARPLSWVAGVFYSNMRGKTRWRGTGNLEVTSQALYGMTAAQRYGVGSGIDPDTGLPILYDFQAYQLKDTEIAGFAEGNYWLIPDRLRLTAGLRVSHVTFDFAGQISGPVAGQNNPTVANGGLRSGGTTEDPITPKFGAQYQLSNNNFVYATASKGYRTGGVNPNLSPALCDQFLTRFGLTTSQVPATYNSDTVWSYEAGGKFRLFDGRVQMNGDVYRIDWSNIQTAVNFAGCGTPFVVNAGSARSQGAEFEAQARLFGGLTANLAIGYTDAKYQETITGPAAPGFTPTIIAAEGQAFAIPDWTVNVGARYDFAINTRMRGYARGDWRWSSSYPAVPPLGVPGYTPDIKGVSVSKVNVRAGVEFGALDVNIFVNNLLNAKDGNLSGGRGGCTAAGGPECTTSNQYNPFIGTSWGLPRQIGFQVAYRR